MEEFDGLAGLCCALGAIPGSVHRGVSILPEDVRDRVDACDTAGILYSDTHQPILLSLFWTRGVEICKWSYHVRQQTI